MSMTTCDSIPLQITVGLHRLGWVGVWGWVGEGGGGWAAVGICASTIDSMT